MSTRRGQRGGFTLAELIVAGVIVAVLASATAGVISTISRAQRSAGARREAFARADALASRVAHDVQQLARDMELSEARVLITDGGGEGEASDEMIVRARALRAMRSPEAGAEGGEYTVQYRTQPGVGGQDAWRRINHALAVSEDGGGIATRMAEGVELLSLEAHDGKDWLPTWDSDLDGVPYGIRVSVRAHATDGRTTAVARRIIAVDRVPVPPEAEESTGTGTTGSATTGGGR